MKRFWDSNLVDKATMLLAEDAVRPPTPSHFGPLALGAVVALTPASVADPEERRLLVDTGPVLHNPMRQISPDLAGTVGRWARIWRTREGARFLFLKGVLCDLMRRC